MKKDDCLNRASLLCEKRAEHMVEQIGDVLGVSKADILKGGGKKNGNRNITDARCISYWYVYPELISGQNKVAKFFNKKSHGSIWFGLRKFEHLSQVDREFQHKLFEVALKMSKNQ
jgi:chromosomal replication initiation ATPase DnaA